MNANSVPMGEVNLTEEMKAYLRGKRYEKEKELERGGGDRRSEKAKNQKDQNDPYDPLQNSAHISASRLADEYNVAEPTIRRDSDFSVGVDAIVTVSPLLFQSRPTTSPKIPINQEAWQPTPRGQGDRSRVTSLSHQEIIESP